jgi:histidinol-phosphate aminotransferase
VTLLTPRPGIMDIAPYVPGESKAAGAAETLKLSSNESALGPSPKAQAAYLKLVEELHRYPDGAAAELRATIGRHYGLDPARIVCGSGSDELIALLVKGYVGPGDEVLLSEYGFLMYPIQALAHGATPVKAPETNQTADVDALLAKVTPKTRMVFLANPNNPTGTYLPVGEVKRLREGLRKDIVLVIDAAYAEYVVRNDYSAGAELVDEYGNVVMTRTFSKIFGLAALRLGWAYCPAEVADVLNRIRGPFNVTAAAQAAGIAALNDVAFTDKARAHNDIWRPWLEAEARKLGLEVTPSVGNFVLIRFANDEVAKADAALKAKGVVGRRVAAYGLPDCLRITVGTEAENRAVIDALRAFKA